MINPAGVPVPAVHDLPTAGVAVGKDAVATSGSNKFVTDARRIDSYYNKGVTQ